MTRHQYRILPALALILLTAGGAVAQTRSDTGRHKPEPRKVERKESVRPRAAKPERPWSLGFAAGLTGGGSLFRLETDSGAAVAWGPEGRTLFTSARFRARLDSDPGASFFVLRRLNRWTSVRADLGYARLDVAAEALQGQSAGVFLFDRLSVSRLGLGLDVRLTSRPSHPFVALTLVRTSLSAAREKELDQTAWGARAALGYRVALPGAVDVRLEAALTRLAVDMADAEPDVAEPPLPPYTLDPEDSLNLFDIQLAIVLPL